MYSAELFSLPYNLASVKPEWTTPAPMHPHDLCRELLARGLDPADISDAFEYADPDLSPTRREYVPTVGEAVLVVNHLGTFVVEEVDADANTASLRVLRSGLLMKDVEWRTICPLDDATRGLFKSTVSYSAKSSTGASSDDCERVVAYSSVTTSGNN